MARIIDPVKLSDDEMVEWLTLLAAEVLRRGLVLTPDLAVATGDDLVIARSTQYLVAQMLAEGVPPRDAAALTKRLDDSTEKIRALQTNRDGAEGGIKGADATEEPFDPKAI